MVFKITKNNAENLVSDIISVSLIKIETASHTAQFKVYKMEVRISRTKLIQQVKNTIFIRVIL